MTRMLTIEECVALNDFAERASANERDGYLNALLPAVELVDHSRKIGMATNRLAEVLKATEHPTAKISVEGEL